MANFLRFAALFVSLLVSVAFAANSCRQCSGVYAFTLDAAITGAAAKDYFVRKLGACATGAQYLIKRVVNQDCTVPDTCKFWRFEIDVYRYCGNGGSVVRARDYKCGTTNGCVYGDYLLLTCTKSVACAGQCDCNECAC